MFFQRMWRDLIVVTSLIALTGLTLTTVGAAQADVFTAANTGPTVSTPSLSASIQPDAGASTTVYTYSVVVGDADTLNDVSTVVLCLYLTTGGDSGCATPDPTTDVEMTWTQSTDTFAIVNGSTTFWALASPVSPTLTAISGTFTFNFTVSEAMREGSWTAAVTATDSSAVAASDSTATTSVEHYSAITTRVSQDFGTVTAGLANGAEVTISPTVTSNGQTTYNMTGGDFTDGTYTFTLLTTGATSVAPAAGQVTYDCEVAGTFTEGSAVRVLSTSSQLSAAQTSTGTPEGGTAIANSCRLAHGGERPVSAYSFAVVNAIGNG